MTTPARPSPGPTSPGPVPGNHPAVLVSTVGGLRSLDAGAPPYPAGSSATAWCEAQVAAPGMRHAVWLISARLPGRPAASQNIQAERLACLVAQHGGLVIAGGNWNGYVPAGQLTHQALKELRAHLRPARMRLGADGRLDPGYHVHQALATAGLADAAAELLAGRCTPPQLAPAGVTGAARTGGPASPAPWYPLERYEQAAGGSDHQGLLLTLRTEAAADLTPPAPLR